MERLVIIGTIIAICAIIAVVLLFVHCKKCLAKGDGQSVVEEPSYNETENRAYNAEISEEIREDGSTHTTVKLVESKTEDEIENGEEEMTQDCTEVEQQLACAQKKNEELEARLKALEDEKAEELRKAQEAEEAERIAQEKAEKEALLARIAALEAKEAKIREEEEAVVSQADKDKDARIAQLEKMVEELTKAKDAEAAAVAKSKEEKEMYDAMRRIEAEQYRPTEEQLAKAVEENKQRELKELVDKILAEMRRRKIVEISEPHIKRIEAIAEEYVKTNDEEKFKQDVDNVAKEFSKSHCPKNEEQPAEAEVEADADEAKVQPENAE